MFKLLKNRSFALLYLGQMVSNLGSGINYMGITLYTLSLDGGLTNIAFLLMMLKLPSVVFGPIAGVLADRANRKVLIIFSDFARGIVGIGLFLNTNVIVFYLLIFVMALFDVLFAPSISGMIPEIVEKDEIGEANAVFAGSRQLTNLFGPVLGGFLVTFFGIKTIFILNGLSFILSGMSELFIAYQSKKEKISLKGFAETYKSDIKEGLVYIRDHSEVKFVIIFFSIASITFGALPILYVDYINHVLKVSPNIYGMFMSLNSLGLILGSFATAFLLKRFKAYQVMIVGVGVYGLLFFIFSSVTYLPLSMGIFFIIGCLIACIDVTYGIYLQSTVDNDKIGRVYSIDMALSNLLIVGVSMVMSMLGHVLNTTLTIKGLCLGMMMLVVFTLLYKHYSVKSNNLKKAS